MSKSEMMKFTMAAAVGCIAAFIVVSMGAPNEKYTDDYVFDPSTINVVEAVPMNMPDSIPATE